MLVIYFEVSLVDRNYGSLIVCSVFEGNPEIKKVISKEFVACIIDYRANNIRR